MTDSAPIVVVGAGHNGLVCAAYLARAGAKVLVLEAANEVGGAAITREFAPGYRVSAGAHLLNLLDPVVMRDLALEKEGLEFSQRNLKTVALGIDVPPLVLDGDLAISSDLSNKDRAALVSFRESMQSFAGVIARQHGRVPPRLAWESWTDALPAATLALDIRRLGRDDMREFLRVATMAIQDVLEESFDSARLKGALAIDGVLGMQLGVRSGNTVLALLHRLSGAMQGQAGSFAMPRGGMGSVSTAIASAALKAGVEVRTGSRVASFVVDGTRVTGVKLATGETIVASAVVSNADPKRTFLELLGARYLDTEFVRRVHHLRNRGNAAKLHLALSGLPRFTGLDPALHGERIVIAPDLDYIESAFNHSKYRECSAQPIFEITIPSVGDDSLAPAGSHVLSAIVQYAPYDVKGGWDAMREPFRDRVIAVLERNAPGLRSLVVASELLAPPDIEREFGISGGHWHHAELVLDQFMMLRPVPGAAQYSTPVEGLFLCGAGSHPGGGVMGTAGRNAARVVLSRKGAGR